MASSDNIPEEDDDGDLLAGFDELYAADSVDTEVLPSGDTNETTPPKPGRPVVLPVGESPALVGGDAYAFVVQSDTDDDNEDDRGATALTTPTTVAEQRHMKKRRGADCDRGSGKPEKTSANERRHVRCSSGNTINWNKPLAVKPHLLESIRLDDGSTLKLEPGTENLTLQGLFNQAWLELRKPLTTVECFINQVKTQPFFDVDAGVCEKVCGKETKQLTPRVNGVRDSFLRKEGSRGQKTPMMIELSGASRKDISANQATIADLTARLVRLGKRGRASEVGHKEGQDLQDEIEQLSRSVLRLYGE